MAAVSGVAIPFAGQGYSLYLASYWVSPAPGHCGVSVSYHSRLVLQYLHITVNKLLDFRFLKQPIN